jgi:hypothetical protein
VTANKHITTLLLSGLVVVALILTPRAALSNPASPVDDSETIPYQDTGGETVFSAAARISRVACSLGAEGNHFDLEIEVFDTCWEPVYSIAIEGIGASPLRAASWPGGWTALEVSEMFAAPCRVIFSTAASPILPGSTQTGFAVLSGAGNIDIRWYPADEAGTLVGKVTRTNLACPMASRPDTWGMIKSIYR